MAHDGTFRLSEEDSAQRVDIGSELRLRFVQPDIDVRLATDKRWQGLSSALSDLAQMQRRHAELLDWATRLGPGRDPAFQSAAQDYNTALVALLKRMTDPNSGPILSPAKLNEIMAEAGRTNGDPWLLLVRHLNELRQHLVDDIKLKAVPAYFVVVRAYRVPPKADPVRLHVENYDNIVSRPLGQPTGFGLPSSRELAEIRAGLAGARLVADSLNEIQSSKKEIRDRLRAYLDEVRATLEAQADSYKTLAAQLESNSIEELITQLRKLNTTEVDRVTARMLTIRAELRRTERMLSPVVQRLKPLRDNGGGANLDELLGLFQAIASVQENLPQFAVQLQTLGKSADGFPADFDAVMKQTQQQMTAQLRDDVSKLSDQLAKQAAGSLADLFAGLPRTQTLVDTLVKQLTELGKTKNPVLAIDSLPSPDIPRRLNDLQDGVVDLGRTEVSSGDKLELHVAFVGAKDGQPDLSAIERKMTYNARLTNTGLHRRFSGDLIFAKAVHGPGSDSFKPNVAVSMEWHYFDRTNRDGLWNRIDPGFGLHAANLDQNGDQAVELGAGVNFSVFSGLLRFGYGYNLAVNQDRQYYWIGFGLFGALNQLQAPSYEPSSQRSAPR